MLAIVASNQDFAALSFRRTSLWYSYLHLSLQKREPPRRFLPARSPPSRKGVRHFSQICEVVPRAISIAVTYINASAVLRGRMCIRGAAAIAKHRGASLRDTY